MTRPGVQPILTLIRRLTREEGLSSAQCDSNMHLLLCWLAAPLQHPGTKLDTAVAIQGGQGSGKSLLTQVMLDIYREHAVVVGPSELHSVFTDWLSNKNMVVIEEGFSPRSLITSREEIKKLITAPTLEINAKHRPIRVEPNKANFIFTSSAPHSFAATDIERRFFVISPEDHASDHAFFADFIHWREREGGAEAFKQFLLDYPITDFSFGAQPSGKKGGAA